MTGRSVLKVGLGHSGVICGDIHVVSGRDGGVSEISP
jgi:hypothetical protein